MSVFFNPATNSSERSDKDGRVWLPSVDEKIWHFKELCTEFKDLAGGKDTSDGARQFLDGKVFESAEGASRNQIAADEIRKAAETQETSKEAAKTVLARLWRTLVETQSAVANPFKVEEVVGAVIGKNPSRAKLLVMAAWSGRTEWTAFRERVPREGGLTSFPDSIRVRMQTIVNNQPQFDKLLMHHGGALPSSAAERLFGLEDSLEYTPPTVRLGSTNPKEWKKAIEAELQQVVRSAYAVGSGPRVGQWWVSVRIDTVDLEMPRGFDQEAPLLWFRIDIPPPPTRGRDADDSNDSDAQPSQRQRGPAPDPAPAPDTATDDEDEEEDDGYTDDEDDDGYTPILGLGKRPARQKDVDKRTRTSTTYAGRKLVVDRKVESVVPDRNHDPVEFSGADLSDEFVEDLLHDMSSVQSMKEYEDHPGEMYVEWDGKTMRRVSFNSHSVPDALRETLVRFAPHGFEELDSSTGNVAAFTGVASVRLWPANKVETGMEKLEELIETKLLYPIDARFYNTMKDLFSSAVLDPAAADDADAMRDSYVLDIKVFALPGECNQSEKFCVPLLRPPRMDAMRAFALRKPLWREDASWEADLHTLVQTGQGSTIPLDFDKDRLTKSLACRIATFAKGLASRYLQLDRIAKSSKFLGIINEFVKNGLPVLGNNAVTGALLGLVLYREILWLQHEKEKVDTASAALTEALQIFRQFYQGHEELKFLGNVRIDNTDQMQVGGSVAIGMELDSTGAIRPRDDDQDDGSHSRQRTVPQESDDQESDDQWYKDTIYKLFQYLPAECLGDDQIETMVKIANKSVLPAVKFPDLIRPLYDFLRQQYLSLTRKQIDSYLPNPNDGGIATDSVEEAERMLQGAEAGMKYILDSTNVRDTAPELGFLAQYVGRKRLDEVLSTFSPLLLVSLAHPSKVLNDAVVFGDEDNLSTFVAHSDDDSPPPPAASDDLSTKTAPELVDWITANRGKKDNKVIDFALAYIQLLKKHLSNEFLKGKIRSKIEVAFGNKDGRPAAVSFLGLTTKPPSWSTKLYSVLFGSVGTNGEVETLRWVCVACVAVMYGIMVTGATTFLNKGNGLEETQKAIDTMENLSKDKTYKEMQGTDGFMKLLVDLKRNQGDEGEIGETDVDYKKQMIDTYALGEDKFWKKTSKSKTSKLIFDYVHQTLDGAKLETASKAQLVEAQRVAKEIKNVGQKIDRMADVLGSFKYRTFAGNTSADATFLKGLINALEKAAPGGASPFRVDFLKHFETRWKTGTYGYDVDAVLFTGLLATEKSTDAFKGEITKWAGEEDVQAAQTNTTTKAKSLPLAHRRHLLCVLNIAYQFSHDSDNQSRSGDTWAERAKLRKEQFERSQFELNGGRFFNWMSTELEQLESVAGDDSGWLQGDPAAYRSPFSAALTALQAHRPQKVPLTPETVQRLEKRKVSNEQQLPINPVRSKTAESASFDHTKTTTTVGDFTDDAFRLADFQRFRWLLEFEVQDCRSKHAESAIESIATQRRVLVEEGSVGPSRSMSVLRKTADENSYEHVHVESVAAMAAETRDSVLYQKGITSEFEVQKRFQRGLALVFGANTTADRLALAGGVLSKQEFVELCNAYYPGDADWTTKTTIELNKKRMGHRNYLQYRRLSNTFEYLLHLARKEAFEPSLGEQTALNAVRGSLGAMVGVLQAFGDATKSSYIVASKANGEIESSQAKNDYDNVPCNMRFLHFYDLYESEQAGQLFLPYSADDFFLGVVDVSDQIHALRLLLKDNRKEVNARSRVLGTHLEKMRSQFVSLEHSSVACSVLLFDLDRLHSLARCTTLMLGTQSAPADAKDAMEEQMRLIRELAKRVLHLQNDVNFLKAIGLKLAENAGTRNSQRAVTVSNTTRAPSLLHTIFKPEYFQERNPCDSDLQNERVVAKTAIGKETTAPLGLVGGDESVDSALTASGVLHPDGRVNVRKLFVRDSPSWNDTSVNGKNVNAGGMLSYYADYLQSVGKIDDEDISDEFATARASDIPNESSRRLNSFQWFARGKRLSSIASVETLPDLQQLRLEFGCVNASGDFRPPVFDSTMNPFNISLCENDTRLRLVDSLKGMGKTFSTPNAPPVASLPLFNDKFLLSELVRHDYDSDGGERGTILYSNAMQRIIANMNIRDLIRLKSPTSTDIPEKFKQAAQAMVNATFYAGDDAPDEAGAPMDTGTQVRAGF